MIANTAKAITGFALFLLLAAFPCFLLQAQAPSRQLAWAIRYDPKSFDPAKVDEQASEMIRYLTGGVLLRINRHSGQVEGALANTWSVSADGRTAVFHLRPNLLFSSGEPLTSTDVVATLRRVLAPETGAPVAEEFLSPKQVLVDAPDRFTVVVHLPQRVVGLLRTFDEIAIEPANRPGQERVTAGPYVVAEYKRGQFIRLEKNPHYWKRDSARRAMPFIPNLRLDILSSPELEQARFLRGEYQLLNSIAPEYFNLLAQRSPQAVHDLGPSLNTEQLWFNQSAAAPLPAFEKQWFQATAFRRAVSEAMHRADLARVAYGGHATPAYTFISPANQAWYNGHLEIPREDAAAASVLLAKAGFHKSGQVLYDAGGRPVRFSILTNAGNPQRIKMAAMIQQDLSSLGMQVTVVTLDFPALIEKLLHTQDYEACLLGLANTDPDPNSMMNLWLSSSSNHQWNPAEAAPATPWEAEIDAAMRQQASASATRDRKRAVDQVQRIVADQQPFIYLVYPNALYAVSPALEGVKLSVLQPGVVWNIDELHLKGAGP